MQQFLDEHGSPGVQHIGLHTPDIIGSVSALKQAGVEFIDPPATYYTEASAADPRGQWLSHEGLQFIMPLKSLLSVIRTPHLFMFLHVFPSHFHILVFICKYSFCLFISVSKIID